MLESEHWRNRAAQMRALAASEEQVELRAEMLKVAVEYDKLGDRAEQRSNERRGELIASIKPMAD